MPCGFRDWHVFCEDYRTRAGLVVRGRKFQAKSGPSVYAGGLFRGSAIGQGIHEAAEGVGPFGGISAGGQVAVLAVDFDVFRIDVGGFEGGHDGGGEAGGEEGVGS